MRHKEILYFIPIHQRNVLFTKKLWESFGPKSNLDVTDETYKRTSDRKSKTELENMDQLATDCCPLDSAQ